MVEGKVTLKLWLPAAEAELPPSDRGGELLSITHQPIRRRNAAAARKLLSSDAGGRIIEALTDRWTCEWTDKPRGSAITARQRSLVGRDGGSICRRV